MITEVYFGVMFVNMTLKNSSIVIRSKTECGTRCVTNGSCATFVYNLSDQFCTLHHQDQISGHDFLESSSDFPVYGIKTVYGTENRVLVTDFLKEKKINEVHNIPPAQNVSTKIPKQRVLSRRLMLIQGDMKYNKMWEKCENEGGVLFQIDNKQKNEEAVKLAKKSGLEKLAIGVYRNGVKWLYSDKSEVTFEDWVSKSLFGAIGWFGVISRENDYHWIRSLSGEVNGGICEI